MFFHCASLFPKCYPLSNFKEISEWRHSFLCVLRAESIIYGSNFDNWVSNSGGLQSFQEEKKLVHAMIGVEKVMGRRGELRLPSEG